MDDVAIDHGLAGRQRGRGGIGDGQLELAAGIVDADQALDAQIENGGGKGGPAGLFPAHAVDEMHQRRRKARGRIK